MKRFLCNIMPALLALLLLVTQARAVVTSPYTHVEGGYNSAWGGDQFFNVTSSTGASGSFSQSGLRYWNIYTQNWQGGPWNLGSSASASFGHLSAYAYSNLTGLSDDIYVTGGAMVGTIARFGDALTITTYGIGQAVLKFDFNVSGNIFVTNASNSSVASLQLGTMGGFSTQIGGSRGINASYPISYTFESGVPFDIIFEIEARAVDTGGLDSSYAVSNFSGSADLNFVGVFDSQGNPITNFTFSSLSGADYGINPVPVPASLLLLGSGLAGLAALGRKFRN